MSRTGNCYDNAAAGRFFSQENSSWHDAHMNIGRAVKVGNARPLRFYHSDRDSCAGEP